MTEIPAPADIDLKECQRLALEQVGRELISKKYDPAFWALALVQAGGSDEAAKAAYIQIRVPTLTEAYAARAKLEMQRANEARQADEIVRSQMLRDDPRKASRYDEIDQKYRKAGRQFATALRVLGVRKG